MQLTPTSYMSEVQAFFLLSTLCDRLVPGYYSKTMYGTLLDQRVFESLVEKTMPILWEHLVKSDVQLSVVSLPWFLSLYINSMPLVFAFRVLDVFFLEGPKVLFQIGLAILRINGEELLDAADDGAFISILKSYFSRLDESAHPRSDNEKLRAVTRFQELMVVAFKEFAGITQNTIMEQRTRHKDAVLSSIESFTKRTQLRNLGPESKRLTPPELSAVYDRYYGVLYDRQARLQMIADEVDKLAARKKGAVPSAGANNGERGRVGLGPTPGETGMDYDCFREFMTGIAPWAVATSSVPSTPGGSDTPGFFSSYSLAAGATAAALARKNLLNPWGAGNPEPADHEFLKRLFHRWDVGMRGQLSLSDVVGGLASVVGGKRDIMGMINYWFELYDDDGDGRVDREGILRITEALLFVTRRDPSPDDAVLGAVSGFTRMCFEYADPDHPLLPPPPATPHEKANLALDPENPLHITLPTFRMVILADEALERFFERGFAETLQLLGEGAVMTTAAAPSPTMPLPVAVIAPKGLRGVLDGIVDEGLRVAAEVRRRVEEAGVAPEEEEDEKDAESRSIMEMDRELLKGAEAETVVQVVAEKPLLEEGEEGMESGEMVGKGVQVTEEGVVEFDSAGR